MKLNFAVEPYVREALAASVAQEPDRFESAVLTIAEQGDTVTTDALNLAIGLSAYALFDIHEGTRPDDEQLQYLAQSFAESEAWAEVLPDSAHTVLNSLADQRPIGLPVGEVAEIVFPLAAWLLSSFPPEDRPWNVYLDRALSDLESGQKESRLSGGDGAGG
jgi:hypothetical protein